MNLLIITQRVDKNDDDLGFFHEWIKRFAGEASELVVIGQYVGEYDLPSNVRIFSLGKEKNNFQFSIFNFQSIFKFRIFKKLKYITLFCKHAIKERKNYDAVFVHMNPEYILLGGVLWRMWRKKTALWYVHKMVDWKLKLAEKLVNIIFTASQESFRLPSKKIIITGHGIDVAAFQPRNKELKTKGQKFIILTAGRIAPVKNPDMLIEACEILKKEGINFSLKIAGSPRLANDEEYFKKLQRLVEERNLNDEVKFSGPIPHSRMAEFYQKGDLFVNLSQTGSMDKAVLEAMSCGLNILTSNEAFFKILPEENIIKNPGPENIAEKIRYFLVHNERPAFDFRDYVVQNHNLNNIIKKIMSRIFS